MISFFIFSSAFADFQLFSSGNFKKANGSGGGWSMEPTAGFKTLEDCSKEGKKRLKDLEKLVLKETATLDQAEIYCRDLSTKKDTYIIQKTN